MQFVSWMLADHFRLRSGLQRSCGETEKKLRHQHESVALIAHRLWAAFATKQMKLTHAIIWHITRFCVRTLVTKRSQERLRKLDLMWKSRSIRFVVVVIVIGAHIRLHCEWKLTREKYIASNNVTLKSLRLLVVAVVFVACYIVILNWKWDMNFVNMLNVAKKGTQQKHQLPLYLAFDHFTLLREMCFVCSLYVYSVLVIIRICNTRM